MLDHLSVFLVVNMDDSLPAVHLRLKLKRNDKLNIAKGANTTDPFFGEVSDVYNRIVEKCKNKTVEERVFPYVGGDDEFREVDYRPFNNAVKLTDKTVLSEEDSANYIVENINSDWALSAIEQLTNIYKEVTLYRLYTHMPFKLKFVIECKGRTNDMVGPLKDSVINKVNLDAIYRFVRHAQDWTLNMIWAAETGEDTYVSSDVLRLYFKLMEDLLEEM